jgi:spoIIIJ-associated protein
MSKELIFEGKTTEEAINAAAKALNVPPENLSFIILSTGSKGLFGLGGRKARIQARLDEGPDAREPEAIAAPAETGTAGTAGTTGTTGTAGTAGTAGMAGTAEKAEKVDASPLLSPKAAITDKQEKPLAPAKVEDFQAAKGQSERGGKPAEPAERKMSAKEEARPKKPEKKPRREKTWEKAKDLEARGKKTEPGEPKAEEGPRLKWSSFPLPGPVTKPGPGETVYEGPPDQATLEAVSLLEEIIKRLGMTAEIQASRIGQRIVLELDSLDNYLLIGRKGASLNALELIINRVVRQRNRRLEKTSEPEPVLGPEELARRQELLAEAAEDERSLAETPEDSTDDSPQIVVDAENYRARRYQGILEKAAYMAEKALKTNKPQVMTQLSSPERRLVHLAIENVSGLTTRSYGFGLVRNLTIMPKKAKANHNPREASGNEGNSE